MASEQLNLRKTIYSKPQYEKVIDTTFSQLASSVLDEADNASVLPTNDNIEKFFQDYQQLFFFIPKFGTINSHEYLIKQSTNYVGSSFVSDEVQALIGEINVLQQQNLELNQQLASLQSQITQPR